jgi:PIN domain
MSQLLFLDTNVFLSFFHFSADDLEALRQLSVLVKRKKVTLLVPDQVVREFHRNRDGKVAEAVKQLQTAKLPTQYPRLCQDFPEYKQMREKLDDYEEVRKSLLLKVSDAARDRKFGADLATEGLFKVGTILEITPEIFTQADQRFRRGDPPGKRDRDSLGDALNWEALLSFDKEGDLFIVAEDTDWASPLDPAAFNSYLQDEWVATKDGTVHFYQRLSSFFAEHYHNIKLATELEKDMLIDELAAARTFAQTHLAIASLRRFEDFTPAQLNAIASAYVNNPQLHWIIDDADVGDFLLRLSDRIIEMDSQLLRELEATIKKNTAEDSPLRGLAAEIDLWLF